jgi:hypothetical protein
VKNHLHVSKRLSGWHQVWQFVNLFITVVKPKLYNIFGNLQKLFFGIAEKQICIKAGSHQMHFAMRFPQAFISSHWWFNAVKNAWEKCKPHLVWSWVFWGEDIPVKSPGSIPSLKILTTTCRQDTFNITKYLETSKIRWSSSDAHASKKIYIT